MSINPSSARIPKTSSCTQAVSQTSADTRAFIRQRYLRKMKCLRPKEPVTQTRPRVYRKAQQHTGQGRQRGSWTANTRKHKKSWSEVDTVSGVHRGNFTTNPYFQRGCGSTPTPPLPCMTEPLPVVAHAVCWPSTFCLNDLKKVSDLLDHKALKKTMTQKRISDHQHGLCDKFKPC